MTAKLTLPTDYSFVKVTDGTNNALISGLTNSVGVFIGSDTPGASSPCHLISEDLLVTAPAIVWVRIIREPVGYTKYLTVSTW